MGGLRATYCSSKCDKKLFLIHTNVLVFIHNYIITDVFIQLFLNKPELAEIDRQNILQKWNNWKQEIQYMCKQLI